MIQRNYFEKSIMRIRFENLSLQHIDIVFSWLTEPFVQEFWDNTQGHKDDILNFVNGRTEPTLSWLAMFLVLVNHIIY